VDRAGLFDAVCLGTVGARILDHIAPEVAEQRKADLLAREEAQAHHKRGFTLSPLGNGQVRLSGYLDTSGAATVTAALDPLCHPRHPHTHTSTGPHGQAGVGSGVGWLDIGAPISAAEVRRYACDAQILPAALGGDSQVLDLGRARRLFTGPLRRALILRDGGCAFAHCDRPARWRGGHHMNIGPTSAGPSWETWLSAGHSRQTLDEDFPRPRRPRRNRHQPFRAGDGESRR